MAAAKNKVQFGISLMLISCILPVITLAQLSYGLHNTGAVQKDVLFTPAFASRVFSDFAIDRRANFNSFDGLYKDALILGQIPFVFTQESLTFLTDCATHFTHRADGSIIFIRAPPCHHKRNS